MLSSIELRNPYLDKSIISKMLATSPQLVPGSHNKYITAKDSF